MFVRLLELSFTGFALLWLILYVLPLVSNILSLARVSILINGSPVGYFSCSHGVCQGHCLLCFFVLLRISLANLYHAQWPLMLSNLCLQTDQLLLQLICYMHMISIYLVNVVLVISEQLWKLLFIMAICQVMQLIRRNQIFFFCILVLRLLLIRIYI